jgi:nucleotide-binding universal stress UspA family protein
VSINGTHLKPIRRRAMSEVPTTRSIVVGIDGSKAAIHAALWATDEAVSRDIPLRLLYAIEPDDAQQTPPDRAARKLAIAENAIRYAFTAVEAADKPVKIEVEITQERPITSLIRASASADMVCVGAVGMHHFRPARVGSTAAALVGSGLCPVAIIRDQGHRAELHPHWIVVDTDGAAETSALLGVAIEEARLRNAPLKVITCRQTGDSEIVDESAAGDDDRWIRANSDRQPARWTWCDPELQVESVEGHGSLLDYLAENSRSVQLVVVGARGNPDVEQLVGPAGNAVLHKSDCSVLIVDPQHF